MMHNPIKFWSDIGLKTSIAVLVLLALFSSSPAECKYQSMDMGDCAGNMVSSWDSSLALFESGQISAGLSMLNTLCTRNVNRSVNIDTLVHRVFNLFCPVPKDVSSLFIANSSFCKTDTLTAAVYKSKIFSYHDESGFSLPVFGFSASYPVVKPYMLKFSGLQSFYETALKMSHPVASGLVDSYFLNQIEDKNDTISCSIFIDPKVNLISMHDYIAEYIDGVFDSISMGKELVKYNALSLRCYKRKNYSIEKGTFMAIISFDKILPDRKLKKGKFKTTPLPVRYTVVVESPGAMRDLAEAKLQTILESL